LILLVAGIARDAVCASVVAVGGVLDELLLSELETFGDASAGFIHGLALAAVTLGGID
jgi:hypothetical protein